MDELEDWKRKIKEYDLGAKSDEYWTLPKLEALSKQQAIVIAAYKKEIAEDDSAKALFYSKYVPSCYSEFKL